MSSGKSTLNIYFAPTTEGTSWQRVASEVPWEVHSPREAVRRELERRGMDAGKYIAVAHTPSGEHVWTFEYRSTVTFELRPLNV